MIKFVTGETLEDIRVTTSARIINGENRTALAFEVKATHAQAAVLFVDGAQITIVQDVPVYDEDGNPTGETRTEEYPQFDYCVAGDIVDHRNGTLTVYMGKKTEKEQLETENAALLLELIGGGM